MDNLVNEYRFKSYIGHWDWQPKRLKEIFGQLTLSDVTLNYGKEMHMLKRIGNRLGKNQNEVIDILRKLVQF